MNRPWSLLIGTLVLSLLELSAISALAQTSSSASSVATAGAGRASVEAGDVHDLNPAMLVHLRDRDLHATTLRDGWMAGLTDNSRDSVVPAALSYSTVKKDIAGVETRESELRLTLAGFVTEKLSMGVTGKQLSVDQPPAQWKRVNADLGFGWIATPKLGVALVFHDLMSSQDDLPAFVKPRPRTAVGFHYLHSDGIRLRADVVTAAGNDAGNPSVLVGYEGELTEVVFFRAGYGIERENDREIAGLGLGLNLPRFRVNYGFRSIARGEGENFHSVDLGIPF